MLAGSSSSGRPTVRSPDAFENRLVTRLEPLDVVRYSQQPGVKVMRKVVLLTALLAVCSQKLFSQISLGPERGPFYTADQLTAVVGSESAAGSILLAAIRDFVRMFPAKTATVIAAQIPEKWLPAIPGAQFVRLSASPQNTTQVSTLLPCTLPASKSTVLEWYTPPPPDGIQRRAPRPPCPQPPKPSPPPVSQRPTDGRQTQRENCALKQTGELARAPDDQLAAWTAQQLREAFPCLDTSTR